MKQSQKNESLIINIRMTPELIWYVNGIFEGYDGFGVVRTIDNKAGLIEILSTKDQEDDVRKLLTRLEEEIGIIIMN